MIAAWMIEEFARELSHDGHDHEPHTWALGSEDGRNRYRDRAAAILDFLETMKVIK